MKYVYKIHYLETRCTLAHYLSQCEEIGLNCTHIYNPHDNYVSMYIFDSEDDLILAKLTVFNK